MTEYKTLSIPTESNLKERSSKFLGFAYPIQSEMEAKARLDDLQLQFPDATHHCFAYRIGVDGENYRYSDDGEPSNSAGSPIFRQILSAGITNVLIVVVRYYGGKKLGVGGLIEAYGECARLCLSEENITITQVTRQIIFRTAFNQAYKAYQLASRMRWENMVADPNDPHLFRLEVIEDEYDEVITYVQDLPDFEIESY